MNIVQAIIAVSGSLVLIVLAIVVATGVKKSIGSLMNDPDQGREATSQELVSAATAFVALALIPLCTFALALMYRIAA